MIAKDNNSAAVPVTPAPEPPPGPVLAGLRDVEAWIFDLDNTLYSATIDLFSQIDERMRGYIAAFLGLPIDNAYALQKQYFKEYGTSLRGLMHVHGMEPGPFLDHVHDIDVSVLPANPALEAALAGLPGRKLIYTNASSEHAERVMTQLGVAHHFDAVFDIVEAAYQPKPEPAPYGNLVSRFGLDPRATVMVEDMARNLAPAAAMGMITAWVRTGSELGEVGATTIRIDHTIDDLVVWLEEVGASRR
jgi:putative hydrolase of the HAD superfamily